MPLETRAFASGDGRIVTLAASGRVTVWRDDGQPERSFEYRHAAPLGVATRAVAAGDLALICEPGTKTALACTILDLGTGRVRGAFTDAIYPARVAGFPGGWLVGTTGGPGVRSRVVHRFDRAGQRLADVAVPEEISARVERELGDPGAASLQLFGRDDGGVWGVPSGIYELWQLAPAVRRYPVPQCLGVVGHLVSADVAQRRVEQIAECNLDAAPPMFGAGPSAASGGPKSYFQAVWRVSAVGDLVAVLVEPRPDTGRGGCRIDIWQLSAGAAVVSSVPLPGTCPTVMLLTTSAVWTRCGLRLERHAFARTESPTDPCTLVPGTPRFPRS